MVCNMCPYHKVCTSKGDGCENCDFAIALWKERKKVISLKARNQKLERENMFLKNQLEDLSEVSSIVVSDFLVDKLENFLDFIKSDTYRKLFELKIKQLPEDLKGEGNA